MVSFTTDEQQKVNEVAPFIPNTSKELFLSIQQRDSDWSLLQILTWRLKHDKDWHRDISLGHRIGFYQVKGNVGRGNFSNVKMAIHSLTKGKFPEDKARGIFFQVCSGVNYMHQQGMIHRDIKAENVFFTNKSHVLLGDFGFAKRLDTMEQHLTTFCGSPPYAAPELFVDDHYIGPSVDVWALGILLYFMVTAAMPFNASTVALLKNLILEGNFAIPSYVSVECSTLLRSILKKKPDKRVTLEDISKSVWMKNDGGWVDGDSGYRSHPRLGAENMSEPEKTVFSELLQLGINEQILKQDLMLGVRSPIIATYRILLHKRLKIKSEVNNINLNCVKSSASLKLSLTDSGIESPQTKTTRSSVSDGSSHKKTKVCTLL